MASNLFREVTAVTTTTASAYNSLNQLIQTTDSAGWSNFGYNANSEKVA